ncbi:unnamed protein product [Nippostrongylus brasiliensis]|uniref:Uncharacterized protein n=1 Tax=Nippostrongylus brasiliensis TaxID=27835 RepID=A0A0N4YL09_NIPBR|nr:unnamed protein product [Nippostrongylus brasiliensis]
MRGLQLIRDQVREHADDYRQRMCHWFDSQKAVDTVRPPRIGSRVFMKLLAERTRSRYPKLAQEWDGPFRVLETSGTSASITRIDAIEEPIRVQMELLCICPQELVVTQKKRPHTRRRKTVGVRTEHEFDVSDEMHCLHARFHCCQVCRRCRSSAM